MFYPYYPFPWPPQMQANIDKPRRATKRPGKRERTHMSDPDFMKLVRKHEAIDVEIKDWLKSKEKKDDKKKEEGKANPMVTGMILFGLAQFMSLAWIYIFLHFGFVK